MSYTAKTYLEASQFAARLRAIYRGTDWRVSIVRPLFAGDSYRVNVN